MLHDLDAVDLSAMTLHFYVHAYNELDLLARAVIEAYDRERPARNTV